MIPPHPAPASNTVRRHPPRQQARVPPCARERREVERMRGLVEEARERVCVLEGVLG